MTKLELHCGCALCPHQLEGACTDSVHADFCPDPTSANPPTDCTLKLQSGQFEFMGKRFTETEYRDICHNLTQFFDLLKTWVDREKDETIQESPEDPAG